MPPSLTTASELADAILVRRRRADPSRAFLVGISGIDGSGKGWVAAQVAARLREAGPQVVSLNVDGWLNLPHIRFNQRTAKFGSAMLD
jgi:uridine kinase